MSKSLLAVAAVAALALAVLGKEFTIMNYPGANCTGAPNVSAVPLDDCLPIPPGHGNFTAAKFGFPREVPIATVFPDATANCTSLGQGFDVPCGRCMDSGRSDIGYHRYLCDLKQQLAHVDLRCDPMCFRCEVHAELVVGQCTPYDNGTKTVMLGSINRSLAIPEILFDGANQTCSWEHDIHVYDLPCDRCVQSTYFNCTITDGVHSERRGPRKTPEKRPELRHVRLPGRLHN